MSSELAVATAVLSTAVARRINAAVAVALMSLEDVADIVRKGWLFTGPSLAHDAFR